MPWQRDASETRYIWPHRVDLTCIRMSVVAQALLDGEEVARWERDNFHIGATGMTDGAAQWSIWQNELDWTTIRLRIELSLDDAEQFRNHVFPADHSASASYVVATQADTVRLRTAETVTLADDGSNQVEVELQRDDLRGEVRLSPWIVLDEEHLDHPAGFATTEAAIVGSGFPVSIWVDEPEQVPGRGIDRQWREFPEHNRDALYEFHIREEEDEMVPTIYFNDREELELASIIDYRGGRRPKAALRDNTFSLLATDVWMQLAQYSAEIEDGSPDPVERSARLASRVLRTLERTLDMSREDLLTAINAESQQSEVKTQIQHWLKTAVKVQRIIGAIDVVSSQSD